MLERIQDPRGVPIKNGVAERFHWFMNDALKALPFETALGRVIDQDELAFGFPAGDHRPAKFWRFESRSRELILHFGFVPNFSWDDLMCKVSTPKTPPQPGAGASVQLNGNKAFTESTSGFLVTHSGAITVRSAVSRETLVSEMRRVAPRVVDYFGGLAGEWWPIELGRSSDIATLVDRLFVWSFGIEQVKLSLRGESPLPAVEF